MTPHARSFVGGMAVGAGAAYLWSPRQAGCATLLDGRGRYRRYGGRAGDIAGLEAATLGPATRGDAPWLRALRLAGSALVLYSLLRDARLKRVARLTGIGLLARGWRSGIRGGAMPAAVVPPERRCIVDVQKTLYIETPVEQVYVFWSDYEHFPLFMSNVREVQDLGGGRSRWRARGPAGAAISWTAQMTERQPNALIAWRSEPGATLENAGVIRFRPASTGTRVDLRFCYRPLGAGAEQVAGLLLGADPRAKLNEDLGRLKALLEATIRSGSYGKESRS